MKIIQLLLISLTISLVSCKLTVSERNTKKTIPFFDFNSVEKYKQSKLTGQIVNDYSNILNPSQKRQLTSLISNYYKKTTRQIALVTVNNIESYTDIRKFSTDLGNYWGIGSAEKNNGILIVFCNPCKQIRIATGLDTQKVLTDDICSTILNNNMIPYFKEGKFYEGFENGITELIKQWK
ncbi:TPM_phosphatase domain-containing protein [Tenacibaculum sp. 190524A02b]|uniref:TPM_phosphatase domain-containing protein n=1 Tax=Tenacibaculum vairaonense TaxID=3137860 RepID=A0ABM9PK89_9FLAO